VTQARAEAALGATPPAVLVLTGVVCVQVGAGLAARLFSQVSPAAVTGLRLWAAALLLAVLGARGLRREITGLVRRRAWADAAVVVAFGLTLAVMNYCIYQAFARIPLGVAVTVEFLGPLAVAVAATRRALDLAWVALAAAGVALLSQAGGPAAAAHPVLSHGTGAPALAGPTVGGLDLAGLLFALAAAASWAIYILLSAATGRRFPGSSGLTVAMIVAALAVTPTGLLAGGGVALLSRAGDTAPAAAVHDPGGASLAGLNVAGLLFALAAAASWAIYILLSAATGRRFPGSSGLTVAMAVAALAVTPVGVAAGGRSLLRPGVLATGAVIGLLSSIIPYSLELETLRRVPAKVFGIWMSVEPAVAALVGLVMLSQSLTLAEWAAIGCVTVASAGAALSAR